tara:strand:+ start:543 stop:1478 length:936 start_codon:yes stop_codon:yes gene_type:complete
MAESFLTLTNKVLVKLNEVELTSSNFTSARGIQVQAQNAVNEAIRYINQREFNYPFNHSTRTETLVPGTVRYSIPTTAKTVDYNTFRIVKDEDAGTVGGRLRILDYNEYVNLFITQEDEIVSTTLNGSHSDSVTTLTLTSTTGLDATGKVFIGSEIVTYTGILGNDITGCTRGAESTTAATHADGTTVTQFDDGSQPDFVVRTLDNNYLLYPFPDKEFTLKYDFFTFPSDMSAHGDTTTIPDRFSPVIVDGAVSYVYQYRGETQQYGIAFARFEQGIKNMQTLLVNKFEYVRSTYIPHTGNTRGSNNVRAE